MNRMNESFFEYWKNHHENSVMTIFQKRHLRSVAYHAFCEAYKTGYENAMQEIQPTINAESIRADENYKEFEQLKAIYNRAVTRVNELKMEIEELKK